MPQFLRTFILACIFMGLTLGLVTIAAAKTIHHHKHHVTHHASRTTSQLRSAQTHLAHLGYYKGKVDGKMGPKTKTALKNFQHDHHLSVTGTLTSKTYAAILEADRKLPMGMGGNFEQTPPPAPDFYATHPDYYGHVHQQYDNPLLLGEPQKIPNSYGDLELTRNSAEGYVMTYNGQPVVTAEDQPAVIGVSQTYKLGTEEAVIVSTYRTQSDICAYQNYLMAIRSDGLHLHEIGNCTHGYRAFVKEDSLFITFPETDDARVVGATFRYENGDLEKL